MSDVSDDALSDGFEFEEDEDEARQRTLMSGPAGGSLAESEARVCKRRCEEVPLPTRDAVLPATSYQRSHSRPCCAQCGDRFCRGAQSLSDDQLAMAADYGRVADFALHFGKYRCTSQILAFAKVLHDRLCPSFLQRLPYDLVIRIALTLSCEHTQIRVQRALRHGDALASLAPCPAEIFDDCMVIALRAERYQIAELLLRQLPEQMTCSAFVRPRTRGASYRDTIQFRDAGAPIPLLDLVGAMSRNAVTVILTLWECSPATNLWEALHWMRCLRQWCLSPLELHGCTSYSGVTGGALSNSYVSQRHEICSLYRSIAGQFGADGAGQRVERAVDADAIVPSGDAHKPPLLAPWVVSKWQSHPFLGGNLCPYAQLLGRCPQADVTKFTTTVEWHAASCCFCVGQEEPAGYMRHFLPFSASSLCGNLHEACGCCRALEAAQSRDHINTLARLEDFLSLPSPTAQTSCNVWLDSQTERAALLASLATV